MRRDYLPANVTKRKAELYRIYLWDTISFRDFTSPQVLDTILCGFFKYCIHQKNNNNIFKPVQNKLFWLNNYNRNNNIYTLLWNYTKYGKRVKIIDTNTLTPTKLKDLHEGDEEKQHAAIKVYSNDNKAVMIFENVKGGVSANNIEKELNNYIIEHYPKLASNGVELRIDPIANKDFIGNLHRIDRIKLAEIWVDRESCMSYIIGMGEGIIDEDSNFAEENMIRDYIELYLKPLRKESINRRFIEFLYNLFRIKSDKIKRLRVIGDSGDGEIRLDTETMKLSISLQVLLDNNNQIDTEDIFEKYIHYLEHDFDDSLSDVVIARRRRSDKSD